LIFDINGGRFSPPLAIPRDIPPYATHVFHTALAPRDTVLPSILIAAALSCCASAAHTDMLLSHHTSVMLSHSARQKRLSPVRRSESQVRRQPRSPRRCRSATKRRQFSFAQQQTPRSPPRASRRDAPPTHYARYPLNNAHDSSPCRDAPLSCRYVQRCLPRHAHQLKNALLTPCARRCFSLTVCLIRATHTPPQAPRQRSTDITSNVVLSCRKSFDTTHGCRCHRSTIA